MSRPVLLSLFIAVSHANTDTSPDTTREAPPANHDSTLAVLTEQDIYRYSNMQLQGSPVAALPIHLLPTQNMSPAENDDALFDAHSGVDRILTGGVPVRAFDALLQRQLFAGGRFYASPAADLQLQIFVRDYKTQFTTLNYRMMTPKLATRMGAAVRPFLQHETPTAHLHIDAILRSRQNGIVQSWRIALDLPECQRLSGAQYIAVQHGESSDERRFIETYTRTAIGQLALAAINYSVHHFSERYSNQYWPAEIQARRGERLQINVGAADVKAGEELTLWHKDDPSRKLGAVRVKTVYATHADVYPINLHSGSLAVGDRLHLQRQAPVTTHFLPPPPVMSCEPEKSLASTSEPSETTTEDPVENEEKPPRRRIFHRHRP